MGQTGSKDKRGMPVPSLPVPPGYAYPPGQGQGQGQGYLQAHLAPGFVPQQAYTFPPGFVPQHGYMPIAMPVAYQQPIMPMQMQMPQPQANMMPQPQPQPPQPQPQPPQPPPPQQPVQPPQRSATHGPTKGIMKGTGRNPVHPPGAAPPPPAQPVIPPAPVIPDPPPPVMPTTAASPHMRPALRRTHTPFQGVIPPDPDDDDDDDDDEPPPPPLRLPPSRRTPTRATRAPRNRRTQSVNVPRPSSAQQPLSRGASLSLNTPERQAPVPPRDVFKDPENREVLERLNKPLEPPQLTRSLTVSAIPAQPFRPEPPQPPPPPPPQPVPQKKKSILRAFSRRSSAKPPPPPLAQPPPPPVSAPPEIYIYPVPSSAATSAPPNSAMTMPIFEGQPGTLPIPPLPHSAPPDAPGPATGPARGPAVALMFNENTEHSGFLNHSPHRIFHDGVSFPSALHLAEAMKFLPHRRDLADQIRNAQDIAEAYAVAAEHSDAQDPTWSSRYLEIMEEVLFLKFSQNADLRQLLSDTEDKRLIYNDPDDEYWSNAGGKGQNCLGVLLERVRDRLRRQ